MEQTETRLQHLITDELGECCEADVERRLDELHELATIATTDDSVSRVFSVLGNDTRYRLVHILVSSEGERCVCELEPLVDVSESAVSHGLSDLADAGLVSRRKDGNWRYYTSTTLADELLAVADEEVHP